MINEEDTGRYQFRNNTIINSKQYYTGDIVVSFRNGSSITLVCLSRSGDGMHSDPGAYTARSINEYLECYDFPPCHARCWNIRDEHLVALKRNASDIGWPSEEEMDFGGEEEEHYREEDENDDFEEQFAKAQEVEARIKREKNPKRVSQPKVWESPARDFHEEEDRIVPRYKSPVVEEEEYNPARSRYKTPDKRNRSGIGSPSRFESKKVQPNYIPPSEY